MFNCTKYSTGKDTHERYLNSDHSLNCDEQRHVHFENLARFFIVIYVFLIPLAMLLLKRRQKAKRGQLRLLESPYRQSFWFFDTLDLLYRLAMTGFLMVIAPSSPTIRMIASLFISFLMVMIVITRPFVNESHNKILIIGQFCVAITIASGYVTSTFDKNEHLTGSLLCVINSVVVVAAFWQSRNERLHTIVDALRTKPPQPIDADSFAVLWMDSGRGPLYDAMLHCSQFCLEMVARSDVSEDVSDQHWLYMASTLLPLTGVDGNLAWEQPLPKSVDWLSLTEGPIRRNREAMKRDAGTEHTHLEKGWLLKRGLVNKAFRRRYFVLVESQGDLVLFWWSSEDIAKKALDLGHDNHMGSIDLADVSKIKAAESHLILELTCLNRTWVLKAENLDEFEKWRSLLLSEDSMQLAARGNDAVQRLSHLSQQRRVMTDRRTFAKAAERLLGPCFNQEATDELFASLLEEDALRFASKKPSPASTDSVEFDEENPRVSTSAEVEMSIFENAAENAAQSAYENPMLHGGFGAPASPIDGASDDDDGNSIEDEQGALMNDLSMEQTADASLDFANDQLQKGEATERGPEDPSRVNPGEDAEGKPKEISESEKNTAARDEEGARKATGAVSNEAESSDEDSGIADGSAGAGAPLVKEGKEEEEEEEEEEVQEKERTAEAEGRDEHWDSAAELAAPQPRRSSIWGLTDERVEDIYLVTRESSVDQAAVTSIEHTNPRKDSDDESRDGEATVSQMEQITEVKRATVLSIQHDTHNPMRGVDELESAEASLSSTAFEKGLATLASSLREGSPPSGFDLLQLLGSDFHRKILAIQGGAAASFIADPIWGAKIKELKLPEVEGSIRQEVSLSKAEALLGSSRFTGFESLLDEEVLPALMCAISRSARDCFQDMLLAAVPGATIAGKDDADGVIELKVGPIKSCDRIAVKVAEYREEKGEEHWPHSSFVTDILRASYICDDAKAFVEAYKGLSDSPAFKVVRLKNKIGECKGPFNLHINILFHPPECENPILCEVQIYPRSVYNLQHRQHLFYELKRASSVRDISG